MIAEMLRSVTAAVILGCVALYLTRDGPIREILRIAAGILVLVAAVQPFMRDELVGWKNLIPEYADVAQLTREQDDVYQRELATESERVIEAYFAERGMELDADVSLEENGIAHVILCFAQTYDWTKEDADAFTEWSGIAPEKQEWIWKSSTGNRCSAAAVG